LIFSARLIFDVCPGLSFDIWGTFYFLFFIFCAHLIFDIWYSIIGANILYLIFDIWCTFYFCILGI